MEINKPNTTPSESFHPTRWEQVESALRAHFYQPDIQGARALYSAFAAHRLPGQPVWLMLVAPPGSLKTELLEALDGLPNVHLIDTVTPKTFLSGQIDDGKTKRERSPSLLKRIGESGILIYPDFSTVLSMNRDNRGAVLSDMRRIYDGHLHKEYGTDEDPEMRDWRGRISFLVGATPDVDVHYSIFQTLGERFVMVRWPRPGGKEAALAAMNQDRQKAKEELRNAVHGLLSNLLALNPELPEIFQQRIAALADFVVRARTHVPRSGYTKEMIYVPEPEAATRLPQELAQLAKGSALLSGQSIVGESDYALIRRVGFDCIPATRRKMLEAAIAGRDPSKLGLPKSVKQYALEDLQGLELMSNDKLSTLASELLSDAGVYSSLEVPPERGLDTRGETVSEQTGLGPRAQSKLSGDTRFGSFNGPPISECVGDWPIHAEN